ncbi:T6SS phospholipase effector Tle1-like catalytic domain-containing protein [Chryseobacterium indoltheticum]|uniref:DUF2235 domain-containing protein n=1 Tax=Chryseobacterium indoltheticum TaxID=254 RepID=A0A3G6N5K1_9FLAO|nr:DUF2235 domain-containing protein [Chryseobacterium indoltheticum]AZA61225.1 DUF2235 domain-containing protein [Chryseobacterium indoltheticum]
MSIEYFVEGKVSSQTEGDQLAFSKGNIAHNGIKNVLQNGTDTGVSYNNPSQVNPNDKPVNTINVSLNLFFDGTLNNKTNTEQGLSKDKKSGSYANDYSNVARGYDAINPTADNQVSWYIEGIGTVDGKSDNDTLGLPVRGAGLGVAERGIKAKVTKGCIKGAEAIKNNFGSKEIDVLSVNVYGFSRGAAAARHFIKVSTTAPQTSKTIGGGLTVYPPDFYELSKAEEKKDEKAIEQILNIAKDKTDSYLLNFGYFGACLVSNNLKIKKIKFNFVGLYDTVASYGANHRGNWFVKNDSEQLGLNAVQNAHFIFQIASADEFRDNFSLTNIESTGTYGLQFTFPGVHSDIGGGYVDGEKENVLIYKASNDKKSCEKYRNLLIEEGWYDPDQISIVTKTYPTRFGVQYNYELWGKRDLSNHYDKLPLHYMFYFSDLFGVKYLDMQRKKNQITDDTVTKFSSQLQKYVEKCVDLRNSFVKKMQSGQKISSAEYVDKAKTYSYLNFINMNTDDLKDLRKGYLHWSANLDAFGMGPIVSGVHPSSERKRTILDG